MTEQKERRNRQSAPVNNDMQNDVDEKEIEIRHQYQMFPTPDETFASEVITELKD